MFRRPLFPLLACLALSAPALLAPPALADVQTTALAAPDIFTTPVADTGLPADLWKGTSADLARQVLPVLASRPLSPAAQALAYRLLATGASAPDGAGNDLDLLAARANVLMALGDMGGVSRLLARTNNIQTSSALSQTAAEAALFSGDGKRACAIGDALARDRDGVYWLRLKSWCQFKAGDPDAAQLTFNLAQDTARDPVFARLMGALLAGAGKPGKASARNGLEYALSNDLNLAPPPPPGLSVTTAPPPPLDAAALATPDLFTAAADGAPATRKTAQETLALLAALGAPLDDGQRAQFAGFTLVSRAAPARLIALDLAAAAGLKAETALLVLSVCADAGPTGLAAADRARLVLALMKVGMADDARRLAQEGLSPAPGPAAANAAP